VPQNATAPGFQFNNLGYLYAGKYIGDAKVLFCPGLNRDSVVGIEPYTTPSFMSTCGNVWQGMPLNQGLVRSRYFYNPRMVDATNGLTLRIYQKTAQAKGHKLFAMDYLENPNGPAPPGMPFNNTYVSHYPSKGWVVLFTDGSARFIYSARAFNYAITQLTTEEIGRAHV